MTETILIIDLGSTSVKSTIFTPDARVLARSGEGYPTAAPHPTWAEQDPGEWWEATVRATRDALQQADARLDPAQDCKIVALGVTGQMHGLVALDRAGEALGPCLTVQDRRAAAEVEAIEDELGDGRAYAVTGARLDAASPAAKLRWLARHQPETISRAAMFLPPKDYLRYRLTGSVATEPVDAAGSLLYDLRLEAWSPELAAAARVDPDCLPPPRAPHSVAGTLTVPAARALGLPAGIPVAVGAGDDVECLGAGLLGPGRALEHLGTTGSMLACSPRIVADPAMRVDCYPHAVPGHYLVGGSTGSAGATLAWAAHNLMTPEGMAAGDGAGDAAAPRLDEELASDPAETLVFLPYLAGERCPVWNPHLRGVLVGMTLGTTGRQIARAVFTGVAYSLRHILDTLRDLDLRIDDVIASGDGGDGAGPAWPRLRSQVYGRPLLLPEAGDPTARGALLLTLVAIGAQPDIPTAAARLTTPTRRVEPGPDPGDELERRYRLYRELSAATEPIFRRWTG